MSARRDEAAIEAAVRRQREAADPVASVWVAANAGAGKTRVLVDRVARLLLAGARPHSVLCLTFTRAAAAEMLRRLGDTLGRWASERDDAALARALDRLTGAAPDAASLARARRLFAATLDAPGGLRVQTIHSFCESILKRFPVEAGLDPGFGVADEIANDEMMAEARERLLAESAEDERLAAALAVVLARVDETGLAELLDRLAVSRQGLRRVLAAHGGDVEAAITAAWTALGPDAADAPAAVASAFVAGLDRGALADAIAALGRGKPSDLACAQSLQAWLAGDDLGGTIEALVGLCLTGDGTPRKRMTTKDVAVAAVVFLDGLRDRVVELCRRMATARCGEGTAALMRLGARLIALHDAVKRREGLLDYDDLIRRAAELLRAEEAAWVRFKLDGGIDHVLVDEAQDTNPEQWAVIGAIAEEFFVGHGAGDERARTVFAVGDPKQSIFGFQGADPASFGAARQAVADRSAAAGRRFAAVTLDFSFRSTGDVLAGVDAIFADAAARDGVSDEPVSHRTTRGDQPGLIELWPLVEPAPGRDDEPWDRPLDYQLESSPPARLASRIAATIGGWIANREPLEARGRPIEPGDVMILVRQRGPFFEAMVRALKVARLPVAGADRLTLVHHIAVQDLLAIGRFALLPGDDLALAEVLKGPLIGLEDDDLFRLCHGREGRLWPALLARADEEPRWTRAVDTLRTALARADRAPPFEFYAALLAEGGRRAIRARLGGEAIEPIEEFLGLALAYEREHAPSLQGFVDWIERGASEVKRDMDEARGRVRVMTVHAAKGLEAPVVFLPDTVQLPQERADAALLFDPADRYLLWPGRKAEDPAACAALRAEAARRREAEYRRLLYVAATRAEDRLIIAGWRPANIGAPSDRSWYALARRALGAHPEVTRIAGDAGEILRFRRGTAVAALPAAETPEIAPPLPEWTGRAAAAERATARPLAPSAVLGDEPAARPFSAEDRRRYGRGSLVHRLLESLPELPRDRREPAARRLLAVPALGLDDEARDRLIADVLAVLDAPDFAPLFGPSSLAETPVAGVVDGRMIAGQVDRLVVTDDEVLVVDYKSNRQPPREVGDVAPVYVAQMALYRALLQQVWPGRRVRCALLWTESGRLMELPEAALENARVNALDR